MISAQQKKHINVALVILVMAHIALWSGASDFYARWAGVPPVSSERTATVMTLGDSQLAYRSGAMTLQTLGDTGGEVTPLKSYNYKRLGQWFERLHGLDPAADHVPMMAAYYFGATRVASDVAYIVDYLGKIGRNPVGEKWRWLAYATYLARYRMDDVQRALDLAYVLSRMELLDDEMPIWARQMPAFILSAKGEKETARAMIEQMLATEQNLHPNEVNFLKAHLVEQLGVSAEEVDRLIRMRESASVPLSPEQQ
jgi:hypothetical protein